MYEQAAFFRIKLSQRVSVWPAHEIDACNDAIIHGRSHDEIRALVKKIQDQRQV